MGLHYKWCQFEWVCPRYIYVAKVLSEDTILLENGAILQLAGIKIVKDGAEDYLYNHLREAAVEVIYSPKQDNRYGYLLGSIRKEKEDISINDQLVNQGYAQKVAAN